MSLDGIDLAKTYPRAFVTGAAGFIGNHVVRRLVEEGVETTCLVLPHDPAPMLEGLRVRIVHGDLSDPIVLAEQMAGASIVFNLAAIYALWLPVPRTMFDVNVGGTRNVMSAARRAGVPRVVHTSSIAAIGTRPGAELADEDTPFCDWDVASDYVLSKYISELEAFALAGPDLDVVAVNPAFPFGANDIGPTPTGKMVSDLLRGRLPAIVAGGFNGVDVRDVAEGHLLAAVRGESRRRYILGGENISYRDFANRVAKVAGRPAPRFEAPVALFAGLGRVAETIATHITRRPPFFTEKSVTYVAGRWLYFSTARAQHELGYRPRPIDGAIAASVAWFKGVATA